MKEDTAAPQVEETPIPIDPSRRATVIASSIFTDGRGVKKGPKPPVHPPGFPTK